MRVATIGAMALMLAGCGHLPIGHRAMERGGETITYATTRCLGSCPAYTLTLGPDGQGIFEGQSNTAVLGERRFQATPAEVRAFATRLGAIRPADGHDFGATEMVKLCERVGTDAPGASVKWQGASGSASLVFYYGCFGGKADDLAKVLRSAPTLLPIADLIGPH